jgi:hypothetical protein
MVSGGERAVSEDKGRFAWPRLPWPVEVFSIVLGYVFYSFVRVLAPDRVGASYRHAFSIESWEKHLGIFHELSLNAFLSRHELLQDLASYYYATLHFVVTPVVLAWLWKSRPRYYSPLRSSLVLATLAALAVYATWPVAPPRFALPGTVDSIAANPVLGQSGHGAKGLINELAAMPSLHVGWALWCAAAFVLVTQSRWRHLAWLYPLGTTLVVVATANHYVLDGIAGSALAAAALRLARTRASLTASRSASSIAPAR